MFTTSHILHRQKKLIINKIHNDLNRKLTSDSACQAAFMQYSCATATYDV